jgi:hypothetical protein
VSSPKVGGGNAPAEPPLVPPGGVRKVQCTRARRRRPGAGCGFRHRGHGGDPVPASRSSNTLQGKRSLSCAATSGSCSCRPAS